MSPLPRLGFCEKGGVGQFEGASALSATKRADALKLTDQQKATIAEIRQEYVWSMRGLLGGSLGI